jgi:glycosyltransferase involved in cell wall biosynthesis
VELSPQIKDSGFDFLLNATFTLKRWSGEIGRHDVYNTHLWPLHLLDIAPAVWYPHEPLRLLYDLRNHRDFASLATEEERRVHVYPKYDYDTVSPAFFQPMLGTVKAFDMTGNPFRIVANSGYCASYLKSVYGRTASRVIYPGVDTKDFLPPLAAEYILAVSQLWPHKRTHLVLQSLKMLEEVKLYIVGDGPEKKRLEDQAKALGVYDRTFFLSGLTHEELHIVYSRALAVVFMPIREPFGIVALEAMAASKPLIAANEGGYVEIVDEGCAFLVPPNVKAIAEKIAWIRLHPAQAEAMGRHGRELAKNYSWDRTADELLEEVEDACAAWRTANVSPLGKTGPGPVFGAHYYAWYGDGLGNAHWNDSSDSGMVREMPLLGYYSSVSLDLLDHHLRMAEEMGLDFFVFNLHVDDSGVQRRELEALNLMLDRADYLRSPVKVSVQLCLYGCSELDLVKLCGILTAKLFSHSNYMTYREKPLLTVFWTGQYDGDSAMLHLLRTRTKPALLLASSLRMYPPNVEQTLTFGAFDGWSLFSPLELCSPDRWDSIWKKAYGDAGAGNLNIRCFTVSPGYDDTMLIDSARRGNPHRKIAREGGALYRRIWDYAFQLSPAPEIVFVSTFNEFHENTHIEPTCGEGSLYLELTHELIQKGRDLWNP